LSDALAKVRFLIVDDHLHLINIVRAVLRGLGATQVFDARTPEAAFEHLRNDSIDIVLLDYMLGDQDGVEFLRRLRTDPKSPAPFVPVIMLTAHTEKRRVEAARDAGANAFCTKPVTPADLLKKVALVIERPQPFVRSADYVGPDRRRRDSPPREPERRKP